MTPEQSANKLLDATVPRIAKSLQQGIAGIPLLAGRGIAPPIENCTAASEKIAEIFSGAVLMACEHELCIARKGAGSWQPVAGHDGSADPVDLWANGTRWTGCTWHDRRWRDPRGEPLPHWPTHFMPLPAPPATVEGTGHA